MTRPHLDDSDNAPGVPPCPSGASGVRTRRRRPGGTLATRPSAAPRQPDTGRANFATSRSVKDAWCSRASRTGTAPRRTSTRAPAGSSTVLRPSHHSTPCGVCGWTSTARTDFGDVTSGFANSACALIGTISSASTSGHTTGPPAENAYAVEPVGVAHTMPSQPKPVTGRPSISRTTSSIRSGETFCTAASLSAQSRCTTAPSLCTRTSMVIRSSTSYARVTTRSTTLSRSSRSASARKPTRPRLTPSIGTPEARAKAAPRSSVPSPPSTISSSQPFSAPDVASGTVSTAGGSGRSAASVASTRTPRPLRSSPCTTSSALRIAAGLPVCASRKTVRFSAPASPPASPPASAPVSVVCSAFVVNGVPPPQHGRHRPDRLRAPRR